MMNLKEKLKAGHLVVGTMISEVRNPNLAYLLAQGGFDFFIIDNEHGSYSPETVSNMIAAARGADLPAVVRIPEIRRETILKPLDAGAAGLLVPQVHTAEQAKEVLAHAKYPPAGNRGAALRRPHSLYRKVNPREYLKQANEETLIAVQAESPEAIENAEAIAEVPGVDVIFVGPLDLSISFGSPGEINLPRQVQATERIVEACSRCGIASGIQLFDLQSAQQWIEKGMRFISYSTDVNMLAEAASGAVTELKKSVKK